MSPIRDLSTSRETINLTGARFSGKAPVNPKKIQLDAVHLERSFRLANQLPYKASSREPLVHNLKPQFSTERDPQRKSNNPATHSTIPEPVRKLKLSP